MKKGFTLVEVLVGSAVFVVVAIAAYGAYAGVFKLANLNQMKVIAVQLANEQFEIARNMTYDDIGIVNGIPNGTLQGVQTLTRGGMTFTVTTIIRNIDLPADGLIGGTPNDLTPADNKLMQITVSCASCQSFGPIVLSGQIAPKNVEAVSTNGSLRIQVLDASGNGVPSATVRIEYTATTTPIIINDTTDNNGILQVIDIPPATQAYNIYISKSGYSSDRTYAPTPLNPNPDKPPATVATQQLTQISFVIDELSKLSFSSVTPSCEIVPDFDFSLKGDRLIGQELSRYYANVSTNSSGILNMDPMEWDSYTVTPNDGAYDLAGINPLNPISLNPGSTQSVQLIAIPKNTNSLLFTIKDSSTDLPLSGVLVKLYRSVSLIGSKTTGQGHLDQADWSGGGGQVGFVDSTKYWSTDGNIDTSSEGNILLRKIFEDYSSNGMLESSTFNTGTSSNFYNISWSPGIQPLLTGENSARLQFATSPSSTPSTWNFYGPDGTPSTYYISPESPINGVHSNDQYARYRVYLSTITATATPNISNVSFTYTSGCIPPGQVIFSGLSSDTYIIEISKSGYSTYSREIYLESSWQEEQILLGP